MITDDARTVLHLLVRGNLFQFFGDAFGWFFVWFKGFWMGGSMGGLGLGLVFGLAQTSWTIALGGVVDLGHTASGGRLVLRAIGYLLKDSSTLKVVDEASLF